MPQVASLLDWNLDAQAFASIDADAIPEILLEISVGGGSFVAVVLIGVLGLACWTMLFLCLCFRDRDTCARCCPGAGKGVLPCGMSPHAAFGFELLCCCFENNKSRTDNMHMRYYEET